MLQIYVPWTAEERDRAIAEVGYDYSEITQEASLEYLPKDVLEAERKKYPAAPAEIKFRAIGEEYNPFVRYMYDTARRLIKEVGKEDWVLDHWYWNRLTGGRRFPACSQMLFIDSVKDYHLDECGSAGFTLVQFDYHSPKIRMWADILKGTKVKMTYKQHRRYGILGVDDIEEEDRKQKRKSKRK